MPQLSEIKSRISGYCEFHQHKKLMQIQYHHLPLNKMIFIALKVYTFTYPTFISTYLNPTFSSGTLCLISVGSVIQCS